MRVVAVVRVARRRGRRGVEVRILRRWVVRLRMVFGRGERGEVV